jgi:tRNA(Ile)-lysidine synthase
MYKKILHHINTASLLAPNKTVIIGISGGPDSVFLLHTLLCLQKPLHIKQIVLAHTNYNLRKSSHNDYILIEKFAKKYQLPLHVYHIHPQKKSEEYLRNARFAFFNHLRKKYKNSVIALGHTQDDNIETFLLFLLRGSGSAGLGGIKQQQNIFRPLLQTSKKDIIHFLTAQNIPYAIDETNAINTYLRNKIRNQIIPLIEKSAPGSTQNIHKAQKNIHTTHQALTHLLNTTFEKHTTITNSKIYIEKDFFLTQPTSVQKAYIAHILNTQLVKNYTSKTILSIVSHTKKTAQNTSIHVKEGLHLHITHDKIILSF